MNKTRKLDGTDSGSGLKVYGVVRKFTPATAAGETPDPIPAKDPVSPPPRAARGDDDLMSQEPKPS